ncbi:MULTISPECIES: DNA-3-methyladenine glycosylase 2 family protein [Streptomyces]|jgi:AraC family transcriptional regulator, regulatory protein of adaptative response / DNA-3-methyladenine glycosylase II|uniref:Methylated-DNA-[protein]-cysteine S-methyltransferase/AraC family transcriptional regulator of adaptative response / DNA-3-methyladenine glycosylase II n=1 Tax=Streptomyces nymphaeiformis TaxID=2663842 RepID=A0A7W7U4K0_9ACTN|nr:DNA-3-methyladenine glycosylase 2 family protein [Streptomyces nymphaeiformis]MBB4984894.1 methylated-DNA-[protein]-cysteine S-methyltransferase/AraC family transcriptional regulator of adaptative response / DNA-3-methyladenine glycosylase II [Streptomyces nymphaeiformis]
MRDDDTRYEAVSSRDARFDGEFFFAVRTTGIYCRPSCPAVTPKRQNVSFYPTAAAAQGHGFRACRRCRPDAVPGSAEWNVRADVVGRAMRMIGDGVVDREGVPGLAGRLGYSTRQVQRQLTAELGAGPVALARAQRAHTARLLLQTTGLPVTEIAFAAGFASVRQFNETIRAVYARTPTALRAEAGSGAGARTALAAGVPLRLAHRGPYAAGEVFDLLAAEAVPRIEEVVGAPGARTYRRTLRLPYGTGVVSVDERSGGRWLEARIHLTELRDLTTAVHRLRRLFDLDADPYAVAERLGAAPGLAAEVAARPGVRSPGTAEPEEFALRTVLGAEESARIVELSGTPLDTACGSLTHVFPEPATLTDHPVAGPLARALADGAVRLDPGADRDEAERALLAVPGVTPEAAALIRMRALGDPDVAPEGAPEAEVWRPWGSYAARYLGSAPRTG